MSDIEFTESELHGINWNGRKIEAIISNCYFQNCELKRAIVRNNICATEFSMCDLTSIDLSNTCLDHIDFSESLLDNAQLYGSEMIRDCTFTGGSIKKANFNGSLIKECKFINTNLSHSDFKTSKLVDTIFNNTTLTNIHVEMAQINKKSHKCLLEQTEPFSLLDHNGAWLTNHAILID